jgi:hypothetical protein
MRDALTTLSPEQFEELVTALFRSQGFEATRTQSTRDGGVDCVVLEHRPLVGATKIIVQAKRYRDMVGAPAVRDLYGTMIHEAAQKAVLITTGRFSSDAHEFAREKPIKLIDGVALTELLRSRFKPDDHPAFLALEDVTFRADHAQHVAHPISDPNSPYMSHYPALERTAPIDTADIVDAVHVRSLDGMPDDQVPLIRHASGNVVLRIHGIDVPVPSQFARGFSNFDDLIASPELSDASNFAASLVNTIRDLEQSLGADDLAVAGACYALGQLYRLRIGDPRAARTYYCQALGILARAAGLNHSHHPLSDRCRSMLERSCLKEPPNFARPCLRENCASCLRRTPW